MDISANLGKDALTIRNAVNFNIRCKRTIVVSITRKYADNIDKPINNKFQYDLAYMIQLKGKESDEGTEY